MPYFSWQGITITGAVKRGKSFARSSQLLDERLLRKDIALLSWAQAYTWLLPSISRASVISFFEQLASLLGSGVLLPEALAVIADHAHNIRLALVVEQVGDAIQQGFSLSVALEQHAHVFDVMVVQLIAVGQEAGKVAASVDALVAYMNSFEYFRKKIRSAALMPAISLFFFCMVFVLIVFIMLPRLADILGTAHAQLPAITRFLLVINETMQGWNIVVVGGIAIGFFALLRYWVRLPSQQAFRDWVALHTPFCRNITIDTQMGWFFAAAALLVRNGLSIVPALTIAKQTVRNGRLRQEIEHAIRKITSGCLVWRAIEEANDYYFLPEVVAIIQVGEQSGSLAAAFQKSADRYHARAMRTLSIIANVIQPLMLIIIGLLVALLIVAIYAPLFNISSTIG